MKKLRGELTLGVLRRGRVIRVYQAYVKELAVVRRRFAEEYVDDSQPAHRRSTLQWVKPTQVVEVSFIEWTQDGYLRHAAFVGVRTDKSARGVRRDRPSAAASYSDSAVTDTEWWAPVGPTKLGASTWSDRSTVRDFLFMAAPCWEAFASA
jgi:ATP-dependent DNA ligase